MAIKKPIDFRFPQWEQSHTQGGNVTNTLANVWQTVLDTSDKRGTMQLRHITLQGANWFIELRVTIDGVAFPIQTGAKGTAYCPWWIFDFNESIKIEHRHPVIGKSRVEYSYYEYRP